MNYIATGNYNFTFDASTATPSLTIITKNTKVNCQAQTDSSDAIPFDIAGSGELFVRGDHSVFGATKEFRLHYKWEQSIPSGCKF